MNPIIFSAPMIKQILAGNKTQTRRLVKPQPGVCHGLNLANPCGSTEYDINADGVIRCSKCHKQYEYSPEGKDIIKILQSPYKPGDVLYVRETWAYIKETHPGCYHYRASATEADEQWFRENGWKWRSSLYMPRAAARIFLKVKNVRVERLQDIGIEDAQAEGFDAVFCYAYLARKKICNSCIGCYLKIWNSLYAKKPEYQWDKNPYVWVVEFERTEAGE